VLLVVLAAAAVGLFVVLSGDDDGGSETTTETTAPTDTATEPPAPQFEVITMKNGAVVGGVPELEYTKGDQIRIEVRLDEPQEDVHIHGYDIEKLNPSGTVKFDFPANLDGIFELEAHGPSGDVPLAEIVVNP
jgi:FtsP/CotA-like multicopper oxidase with cupredoxin domain